MSVFALKARWVLPIDAPPIEGGVVTIHGDRISAIANQAADGATVEELEEAVLLPGLVNAHTHLEFSHFQQPLGKAEMSLPEWIRLVIASRKQSTDFEHSVGRGILESLRFGVTTLGEIATQAMPTDAVVLPEVIAFQEVIGFSAARVESVFADITSRLEAAKQSVAVGVSPHAPYTVHPKLLDLLVGLACERSLPVAMHLAESPEELMLLRENKGPFRELLEERSMWDDQVFAAGLRPLDYLQILERAPRALVIHGNYFDATELEFLANHRDRMAIVHCPRTHAYFGHESYPLEAALESGVQLAIGTDSKASNPDLSLLGELRFLFENYSAIQPEVIVKLGTLSGARALGMENTTGSITPGKLANLTALNFNSIGNKPEETILSAQATKQRTWLRGLEIH